MNKEKLDKIESKIDEALANETSEKSLGWMWKDIEKEDSMNFICQDPDCPHCIEEINQMRDDDDYLEDDLVKLVISEWNEYEERTGNPPYMYHLGFTEGYNKAKETLYTEEQVMEGMLQISEYYADNFGKDIDGHKKALEIIKSLK